MGHITYAQTNWTNKVMQKCIHSENQLDFQSIHPSLYESKIAKLTPNFETCC